MSAFVTTLCVMLGLGIVSIVLSELLRPRPPLRSPPRPKPRPRDPIKLKDEGWG